MPSFSPLNRTSEAGLLVNNALLRHLLAVMAEHGFDSQRLCRGLGMHPQDIELAGTYSSFHQARQLIVRCQRLVPSPLLGMWVGEKQTLLSMGVAGVAVLAAKDFLTALRVAIKFPHQVGSMLRYTVHQAGDLLVLQAFPRVLDTETERFNVTKSFVGVLRTAQLIGGAGSFKVIGVQMSAKDPMLHHAFEQFVACPVSYHPTVNQITIETSYSTQILPTHDPLVYNHSLYLLEQQEQKLLQKRGVSSQVENTIRSLSLFHKEEGCYSPSAEEVAEALCMASRTLRRKLALSGTSFQTVLEQVHKTKAMELLRASPPLTLLQVAQQTGYESERSFRRAFQRWTGMSPSKFRKQLG